MATENKKAPSPTLIYVNGNLLHRISYKHLDDGTLQLLKQTGPSASHSEKCFRIAPLPEDNEATFILMEAFLSILTGESTDALHHLSKLFYRIMANAPGKACATVVYSPLNADALHNVFSSLLECYSDPFPYPLGHKSISLNALTQKKHLMTLAEQNVFGRPLLLINDTKPSVFSHKDSYSLCHGASIKLSDPYIGGQSIKNHVHLLCITSDPTKAKDLSDTLSIPLIDFSETEQALSADISFSKHQRNWLLTALPLYGMALNSAKKASKTKPSKKSFPMDNGLVSFLTACCYPGKGIPTTNLYNAYCVYHVSLHGCDSPLRPKGFTAKMNLLKNSPFLFKYDRLRPHLKTARYQFLGICLKENWRDLLPTLSTTDIPDDFAGALWTMNTMAMNFVSPSFGLGATSSSGD